MPVLSYTSSTQARQDSITLRLDVSHFLLTGDRKDTLYDLRKPLPASVNVYSYSDLTIIVSAIVDGHRLASKNVKQSVISRHLIQTFRQNATLLGINNVSDAYIDENDDQVKGTYHITRTGSRDSRVSLDSMQLTYICKTAVNEIDVSSALECAPLCSVLNQALDKFLTYHLVKRYPIIFGPWGEKLEQEKVYFPSIARSLISMVHRSPNNEFRSQAGRYLRLLRKRIKAAEHDASDDLQKCFDEADEDVTLRIGCVDSSTDEDTLGKGLANGVTQDEARMRTGANLLLDSDNIEVDWNIFGSDDADEDNFESDCPLDWSFSPPALPSETMCSWAESTSDLEIAEDDSISLGRPNVAAHGYGSSICFSGADHEFDSNYDILSPKLALPALVTSIDVMARELSAFSGDGYTDTQSLDRSNINGDEFDLCCDESNDKEGDSATFTLLYSEARRLLPGVTGDCGAYERRAMSGDRRRSSLKNVRVPEDTLCFADRRQLEHAKHELCSEEDLGMSSDDDGFDLD
ncbi:hypothetical protein EW145_g524 [Phellinidium pouzarii]|uniref:Uncharacterized protein n=1 Tax=Phellinidium pouzarii TaxID=167371 RepID=A0A4V3XDZ3_9AGAM|nr:hypothetical protein EW145_g524 [Phellinidium pouzarii]